MILHEKPDNEYFISKLGKDQHKACLAIIGAMQETLRERLYDELGLMPLKEEGKTNHM